ncbi:MAG: DUF4175 family protein [Deltaproteobacteria bacterium]|nr:MAG: DUF4175 family protein [Deltaproteobacteria bacterium]
MRTVAGVVGVLLALGILWRAVLRPLARLRHEVELARTVERAVPEAAGLASAVEFRRAGGVVPFSRELADAHVERTAGRIRDLDPSPAFPARGLKRATIALLTAIAVNLLLLLLLGEAVSAGWSRLLGTRRHVAELERSRSAELAPLITGDVELTYRYPAYTGLSPRTVRGTGGEISALKGTEVEIRTSADRDLAAAQMVVGDLAIPLEVEGRRLEGRLTVSEPATYRFRFLDADGNVLAEGRPHEIAVEPDAYPEVEVEVLGHEADEDEIEVREQDSLVLAYRARDDFGISEVALAYRVQGGGLKRIVLDRPDGERSHRGRYTFDLATLHLAPGDRVAWYVEVLDNDAVSGPKRGSSRTRYLKVFSAAEHHRELMAKVEEGWEALLSALADHLEAPFEVADGSAASEVEPRVTALEAAQEATTTVVERLGDLVASLSDDPLAPAPIVDALTNIRDRISRTSSRVNVQLRFFRSRLRLSDEADGRVARLVERAQRRLVEELEKDVLYLEDLLDKQKVQDLVAMAEELRDQRRRLAELIDELKKNPSEETRAAISEEIARIKERIFELMQKMQELAKSINDEFLNTDALREMNESQDMLSTLDEVQRLLNEGDLDGALKKLSEMAGQLDQMLENLREQDQSFGGEEYAELGRQIMEFSDALQRLKRDQERLLEASQDLKEKYQRALEERVKGRLDELAQRLAKKAKEAEAELSKVPDEALDDGFGSFNREMLEQAVQRMKDTAMLLEARDFEEARRSVEAGLRSTQNLEGLLQREVIEMRRLRTLMQERLGKLEEARGHTEGARARAEEILKALEQLFPDPSEVFDRQDRRRMEQMARKQEALRQRAAKLQKQMEEIGRQAPVFSPSMEGMLQQAGRHMAEAQQQLQQSDARRAGGQQKAAADRLGELQKQMEEAMQRGGGGHGGIPMPLAGRRPGGSSGRLGMSHQPVKIPDEEAYEPPEAFRKELMEAMKDGAPKRYEREVKRYYEELVK